MLERRKEESESIGKYQTMLMSGIIAAVIVFLAPTLIIVITGTELEGDQTAEQALFAPPERKLCKELSPATGSDPKIIPAEKDADGEYTCEAGYERDDKSILPGNFSNQIEELFGLLIWVVRIVIVMMIIVAVIMLYVEPVKPPTAVHR